MTDTIHANIIVVVVVVAIAQSVAKVIVAVDVSTAEGACTTITVAAQVQRSLEQHRVVFGVYR